MFERYTEKARRTIFFGRYEASQFGSLYIETEHLLLGLLREDKALANHILGSRVTVESIRQQIESQTPPREKVPTEMDLPLSHDSKRALAYGAEEAERLNDSHIGNQHLLLGLLRQENCFAAQLLLQRGVTLDSARELVQRLEPPWAQAASAAFARLNEWLAQLESTGGVYSMKPKRIANRTTYCAIYVVDQSGETVPAEILVQLQRIDTAVAKTERAIANHEFAKARFCSEQEREEREMLRRLQEKFNLHELPSRPPLLCIDVIRDEPFFEIQQRSDDYIAQGVAHVWLLYPRSKRAYTVTKADGLRESRDGILRIPDPPLELDLRTIFG